MLDRVTDGNVVAGLGKQTFLIGGSSGAIIDVHFHLPGVFSFVNHDYSSFFKGQSVLIVVDGPDISMIKLLNFTDDSNPSNAIPPVGNSFIPVTINP